ncbi:uncharacterized protein CMC5_058210 [Chondromyces crocatus]|uniref:Uncharacterized protein n=1 Tax=Chondromyces crocatus TaxID=52 RepID=A0A0K1EL62_CHOCO|nr:uncharacterized protein CMC5_058210 [Chondromyces crocatus]
MGTVHEGPTPSDAQMQRIQDLKTFPDGSVGWAWETQDEIEVVRVNACQ